MSVRIYTYIYTYHVYIYICICMCVDTCAQLHLSRRAALWSTHTAAFLLIGRPAGVGSLPFLAEGKGQQGTHTPSCSL